MVLPVYYCKSANFGDCLNNEILKKYIGVNIAFADVEKAEVIGIGSLLECLLQEEKKRSVIKKPIRVFSTGFGFEENGHPRRLVIQPERLKREIRCYAVRGRMSLKRLEKMTGNSLCDTVIADGGLLAGKLLEGIIKKEYRLGIVPHMADQGNELWKELERNIPNSQIIDVTQSPLLVLNELAKCEVVVSSGLHPLIACDSMGIPNAWIKVSDVPSSYKFKDYYSAFDLEKGPYMQGSFVPDEEFVNKIQKDYDISKEQVEKKQMELLQAMELMKVDIKKEKGFAMSKRGIKNVKEAICKRYFDRGGGVKELNFSNTDRILVVSPHPDDECIGCGGLLLQYGNLCDVLMLTDGQKSRPRKEWTEDYVVQLRRKELETAMNRVGAKKLIYTHWNDGYTMQEEPRLELELKDTYDYIFVPNSHEKHPDHKYANKAIKEAVKRQRAKAKVMEYEVWSTISEPSHYLGIDMEKKSELIAVYQSQLMHINYIDRMKGLNYYRGMSCHSEYAECYFEVKEEKLDYKIMQKLYSFYRKRLVK